MSINIDSIQPKHGTRVLLGNPTLTLPTYIVSGVFSDDSTFSATANVSATFVMTTNITVKMTLSEISWVGSSGTFESPANFVPLEARPAGDRAILLSGNMNDGSPTAQKYQVMIIRPTGIINIYTLSAAASPAENIIPATTVTYVL